MSSVKMREVFIFSFRSLHISFKARLLANHSGTPLTFFLFLPLADTFKSLGFCIMSLSVQQRDKNHKERGKRKSKPERPASPTD